jgi:hypothetical protein
LTKYITFQWPISFHFHLLTSYLGKGSGLAISILKPFLHHFLPLFTPVHNFHLDSPTHCFILPTTHYHPRHLAHLTLLLTTIATSGRRELPDHSYDHDDDNKANTVSSVLGRTPITPPASHLAIFFPSSTFRFARTSVYQPSEVSLTRYSEPCVICHLPQAQLGRQHRPLRLQRPRHRLPQRHQQEHRPQKPRPLVRQ